MKLFNFFRQKSDIKKYTNTNDSQDLTLMYKSGTVCKVRFLTLREIELKDGSKKVIQEAEITYTEPNQEFEVKNIIMDPQTIQDEQGNEVNSTKLYYENLAKLNMPLVKGFFQRSQVDALENGYIGYIGTDQNTGKPNRSFDFKINNYFNKILDEKKKANSIKQDLREKTYRNEVEIMSAKLETHTDKTHEKILTKDDYKQCYGDR